MSKLVKPRAKKYSNLASAVAIGKLKSARIKNSDSTCVGSSCAKKDGSQRNANDSESSIIWVILTICI